MISSKINLSTGPVAITREVQNALCESPLSHRSVNFRHLFYETTDLLCTHFNVKSAYLLTGSGTLANEAMLFAIKQLNGKGLILSNGEFGNRLIDQANRVSLKFIKYQIKWGEMFEINLIGKMVMENKVQWVLFCHCETSTGVINNLDAISAIAKKYDCRIFVDCMSTVGTRPLDLSSVSMATASSGKGLASIPGLAIVLSNLHLNIAKDIPVYTDLGYYEQKNGIPFTISSNSIKALNVSIKQKLTTEHYDHIQTYSAIFYDLFANMGLAPFSNSDSVVFTIILTTEKIQKFLQELEEKQISISYESDYLRQKGWCQLALFGYYNEEILKTATIALKNAVLKLSEHEVLY
jgi:aspartate aminotransferase-like enzyme